MLYFLYGESNYHAFRKVKEFKDAFQKKNSGLLIEEYDGDSGEIGVEKFHATLGQANLFSNTRLVIFKNIITDNKEVIDELKANNDFLRASKDVFVFWEREPEAAVLTFFKKYSEKTQEVGETKLADLDKWLDKRAKVLGLKLDKNERRLMIEEAGSSPTGGAEWALEGELEKLLLGSDSTARNEISRRGRAAAESNSDLVRGGVKEISGRAVGTPTPSPFPFIDKMFGPQALLALKEMSLAGIDPSKFIYAFLWKLKQKHMYDAYFECIKAESQIRRDPKNAEEILEKFIFSLNK